MVIGKTRQFFDQSWDTQLMDVLCGKSPQRLSFCVVDDKVQDDSFQISIPGQNHLSGVYKSI